MQNKDSTGGKVIQIHIDGNVSDSPIVIGDNNVGSTQCPPASANARTDAEEASLISIASDFINKELNKYPVLIELTMSFKPSLVDSALGKPQPETLVDQSSILEIFEHPNGKGRLLVAGKAGSGKSLLLFKLAKILLEQANQNIDAPIPFFYDLSEWRSSKDIETCLQEYFLKNKLIKVDTFKQWLTDRRKLVLLFDGLEQLSLENQYNCVIAINDFIENWKPERIVVCIRDDEYEEYKQPLKLNNAVYIQSLNESQLENYFHTIDNIDRWNLLVELGLTKLIQQPSLLSIVEALSDDDIKQIRDVKSLIEKYIAQKGISDKEITWLKWIARQVYSEEPSTFAVDSERLPIFSVAKLQPSMLDTLERRSYFFASLFVISLISFAAISFMLSPILLKASVNSESTSFFAVLIALVAGFIFSVDSNIYLPVSVSPSWKSWRGVSTLQDKISHFLDNNISIIVIAIGFSVSLTPVKVTTCTSRLTVKWAFQPLAKLLFFKKN